jgi:hypothetical protein
LYASDPALPENHRQHIAADAVKPCQAGAALIRIHVRERKNKKPSSFLPAGSCDGSIGHISVHYPFTGPTGN